MLKARADQGCPHAKKQLEEIESKTAKINIKPKTDPKLAELEERAAQGCPHAKSLLEKMKDEAASKETKGKVIIAITFNLFLTELIMI